MNEKYLVSACLLASMSLTTAIDLVRVDPMNGFEETSSDLGDYAFFDCKGVGEDRTCSMDQEEGISYASGVAVYGAINMLAIVIIILIIMLNITWNLCKLCGRCCHMCCTCCCKKTATPAKVNDPATKFSKRDYCRMMSLMFVILGIPILFTLGLTLGSQKVSENSYGLVNIGAGFQGMVMGSEPAMTNSMLFTVAEVVVPLVQGFNETFTAALNLTQLVGAVALLNESLPDLPQARVLLDIGYEVADKTTVEANPVIDQLIRDFAAINNTVGQVNTSLGETVVFIDELSAQNSVLSSVLNDTSVTLGNVRTAVVVLVGDGSSVAGIVNTAQNDLSTFPDSATLSTGGDAAARVNDNSVDGDEAGMADVVSDLTAAYNSIKSAVNFSKTADSLLLANSTMNSMIADGGLFDQLISDITSIETTINNYPSFDDAANIISDIDSAVRGMNISGVLDTVDNLIDIFLPLPSIVTKVYDELNKLHTLTDLFEIPAVLRDQVLNVNRTFMLLPDKVQGFDLAEFIRDYDDNFNVTSRMNELDDYLDEIFKNNDTIVDALDTLKNATRDASDFQTDIDEAIDSFNVTDLVTTLQEADDLLHSTNFTDALDLVNALRSDIAGFSLDWSFIDSLRTVSAYFETASIGLQRVVDSSTGGPNGDKAGDYILLAGGYCSGDDSVDCTSDTDCSGVGTCTGKGSFRCAGAGSTSCTADSDCSSYCLADSDRANTLELELKGYSSVEVDTSSISDILSQLSAFDSSVSQLDQAQDSITAARDGINTFDISSASDRIADVQQQIDDADIQNYIDDLISNKDQINDLEIRDKIEDYEEYADKQEQFSDDVSDFLVSARYVRDFIFDPSQLARRLELISLSNLQQQYKEVGPMGAMAYFFGQVDDTIADLKGNMSSWSIKQTNLRDEADMFKYLDRMGGYPQTGYGDMRDGGSVYYFQRLAGSSTVRASYPALQGVFVDSNGDEYPDDNTCTLEKCEKHTLDVINYDKIDTWSAEIPSLEGSPSDSIPFTREELWMLLWVPPLLTAFFAVFVFAFNFKFYNERMRKCCTCMFQGMVICQIPFILLITALFFPMSVIISDMCTTGGNVPASYLVAYGDESCTELFGGEGTLRSCKMSISMSNTTINFAPDENKTDVKFKDIEFTVDILDMYNSLVVSCDPNADPMGAVMSSIADQVGAFPSVYAAGILDNLEPLNLREGPRAVIREFGYNLGNLTHNFIQDFSDGTLSCQQISAIFSNMSGSTCGSFSTPSLWLVGSWYLAGWILVLCAFPAGCLTKRWTQIDAEELEEREDLLAESDDSSDSDSSSDAGSKDYSDMDENDDEGNNEQHAQIKVNQFDAASGNTGSGDVELVRTEKNWV